MKPNEFSMKKKSKYCIHNKYLGLRYSNNLAALKSFIQLDFDIGKDVSELAEKQTLNSS